jgi:hypothetical protein
MSKEFLNGLQYSKLCRRKGLYKSTVPVTYGNFIIYVTGFIETVLTIARSSNYRNINGFGRQSVCISNHHPFIGLIYKKIPTGASFSVCNLIVEKRYKFRFATITPAGVTDYIETVSKIFSRHQAGW